MSQMGKIKYRVKGVRNRVLRFAGRHVRLPQWALNMLWLRCRHCGQIVDYRGSVWEQAERAVEHSDTHYPFTAPTTEKEN